jgi:hypothetical protein
MLVAPGPHKIRVSLPGYQTFETEVNALPKQKVEVKTNLLKAGNDAVESDRLMKPGSENATPIPPPEPLPKARQKDTTPIPPPDRSPKAGQKDTTPIPPPDPLPPPRQ